ncbi:hypothetical protein [Roseicyclus mahoneyensis]|uniref:Flp pilus assembly pilin Flp n=1 Tax=Roseicyclus mahoneyensis TaxID=164332 RepID=A0A316GJ17_9RHOB|nr:hypothetical protein [Roseicyclus mahoneyensis]PWK60223.1 hypothetical protein C7455_105207 [Roseicyclus mahoneyensis]
MSKPTMRDFARFLTAEDGGMSVEWVTIAAACMALLLGTFAIVSGGTENLATDTAQLTANMDVANGFITPVPITASTDITAD